MIGSENFTEPITLFDFFLFLCYTMPVDLCSFLIMEVLNMEIDFTGLVPQKRETAQQILASLDELSAAYAADTHTHTHTARKRAV